MDYEPYNLFATEQNTRFQFQSIGKRGVFEKVISFVRLNDDIFNLALLDYDPRSGEESDLSISDNGDLPEILVTTMKAIMLFLEKHPEKYIYFKGSTESRTRLYQISINKTFSFLKNDLIVMGQQNGEWIHFEPNVSFESFLIAKKALT
jgi:hypothetical protein